MQSRKFIILFVLSGSCQGSFSEANAGKVDLDLSIYACWSSPSWGNYWCCGE
uniref:Uncharacterized protein LOC105132747 n=1 Tax=Rhizophora mucronata TaxID=61149 RepID=A0A2P2MCY4_RHIMU